MPQLIPFYLNDREIVIMESSWNPFTNKWAKSITKHFTISNIIVGMCCLFIGCLLRFTPLPFVILNFFGFTPTPLKEYAFIGCICLISRLGLKGVIECFLEQSIYDNEECLLITGPADPAGGSDGAVYTSPLYTYMDGKPGGSNLPINSTGGSSQVSGNPNNPANFSSNQVSQADNFKAGSSQNPPIGTTCSQIPVTPLRYATHPTVINKQGHRIYYTPNLNYGGHNGEQGLFTRQRVLDLNSYPVGSNNPFTCNNMTKNNRSYWLFMEEMGLPRSDIEEFCRLALNKDKDPINLKEKKINIMRSLGWFSDSSDKGIQDKVDKTQRSLKRRIDHVMRHDEPSTRNPRQNP